VAEALHALAYGIGRGLAVVADLARVVLAAGVAGFRARNAAMFAVALRPLDVVVAFVVKLALFAAAFDALGRGRFAIVVVAALDASTRLAAKDERIVMPQAHGVAFANRAFAFVATERARSFGALVVALTARWRSGVDVAAGHTAEAATRTANTAAYDATGAAATADGPGVAA
jgi:hypothetical protein